MFTLEIGTMAASWIFGVLLILSIALALVAGLLWRQQRQLQRSLGLVSDQVSVFAEASISVAHTVEQSLVTTVMGRSAKQSGKPSASRRELLQVAARRLAQKQSPLAVQQALNLNAEELKLLQVGAASAQVPLAPSQPLAEDVSLGLQPVSRAPRAVA